MPYLLHLHRTRGSMLRTMLRLSAVEARVLGALMEKEVTTPEYYPLSLNALVSLANSNCANLMLFSSANILCVIWYHSPLLLT